MAEKSAYQDWRGIRQDDWQSTGASADILEGYDFIRLFFSIFQLKDILT